MSQVACLGILVADVVGKVIDTLPPKGTLAAVERVELHVGGCAANTSVGLARLGVGVSLLGRVGADGFSRFLLQTLSAAGVGTGGVVQSDSDATSATIVAVDAEGERTFLHAPGANASYTGADVDWEQIGDASILHLGGPFLMRRFMGDDCAAVLRRARAEGRLTTLDTVWDHTGRWMSVLEPSLPHLDYLLPSWEEARLLTGRDSPREIAQTFLDKGVGAVCLKLGAQGCYLRTASGDEVTLPALHVPVMDALGAGDAWAAGFLCGLTHGWDLERSARFANAVGACAVQALGATTGIQDFETTYRLAFGEAPL
jgi:sugar/nucleoside kinase (ribokinase family)